MTTVQLADGSLYPIPTGAPGSWPWVREASLIAVSYQQAPDMAKAVEWRQEYERRLAVYQRAQAGEDLQMILNAGSWLDGPTKIVAALARTANDILRLAVAIPQTVVNWGRWLPWLVAGALVVVGLGLHRKSITIRR